MYVRRFYLLCQLVHLKYERVGEGHVPDDTVRLLLFVDGASLSLDGVIIRVNNLVVTN